MIGSIIVVVGTIATLWAFAAAAYWTVRPGETNPEHPKRMILRIGSVMRGAGCRAHRFWMMRADPIATYRPPARFRLDTRRLVRRRTRAAHRSDGRRRQRRPAPHSVYRCERSRNNRNWSAPRFERARRARHRRQRIQRRRTVRSRTRGIGRPHSRLDVGAHRRHRKSGHCGMALEYFPTPSAFAQTPTYAPNPDLAAAGGRRNAKRNANAGARCGKRGGWK